MKKTRLNLLFLALVAVFAITGCNKETRGNEVPEGNVMHATFMEETLDTTGVQGIVANGDEIVFLGRSYNEDDQTYVDLITCNLATGEKAKKQVYACGKDTYMGKVSQCKDGFAVSFEKMITNGENYSSVKSISLSDEDFNLEKELDLSKVQEKVEEDEGYFYIDNYIVDDNYAYVFYDRFVFKVDMDGNIVASGELECWPDNVLKFDENRIVISGPLRESEVNRMGLFMLDTQSMTVGEPLENVPDSINQVVTDGKDGLYIVGSQKLYKYDVETSECKEVLDWIETSILIRGLSGIAINEDGSIVLVTTGYHYDENSGKSYITAEISSIKEVPASSVPVKKDIKVVALYADNSMADSIVKFNRTSEKYRLSLKSYVDDDLNNFEEAQNQFKLDVAMGNLADVYIGSTDFIDFSNIAAKGIFADLRDVFKDDPYMNLDNFIPEVVNTLSMDGKVYGISPTFTVSTLVGNKNIVGEAGQLTFEKLLNYMRENPETNIIDYSSGIVVLTHFLSGSMDAFCNPETGVCSFDSDEFISLLEITKLVLNGAPWFDPVSGSSIEGIINGKILLTDMYIGGYEKLQIYRKVYKDILSAVGYPGAEGSGAIVTLQDVYYVDAKSKNKEGATEFIKYIFEATDKKLEDGRLRQLPVRKESLDRYIADCKSNSAHEVWYYDSAEVTVEPMTDEDEAFLWSIIGSIKGKFSVEQSIKNIIFEDAPAFFEGKKSAKDVAAIIQSRAQIAIDEQR